MPFDSKRDRELTSAISHREGLSSHRNSLTRAGAGFGALALQSFLMEDGGGTATAVVRGRGERRA